MRLAEGNGTKVLGGLRWFALGFLHNDPGLLLLGERTQITGEWLNT